MNRNFGVKVIFEDGSYQVVLGGTSDRGYWAKGIVVMKGGEYNIHEDTPFMEYIYFANKAQPVRSLSYTHWPEGTGRYVDGNSLEKYLIHCEAHILGINTDFCPDIEELKAMIAKVRAND